VPLLAVNDATDADLHSDEVETVGGLVLDELDRVSTPGDRVETAEHVLEVEAVDGNRITMVVLRGRKNTSGPDDDPAEDAEE
jgi:CBS domain containing-hemolysin-like protein